MSDGVGHVKANAPCSNDGHLFTNGSSAVNSIDITHYHRVIDARDVGLARDDTCCNHRVVKVARRDSVGIDPGIQFYVDT